MRCNRTTSRKSPFIASASWARSPSVARARARQLYPRRHARLSRRAARDQRATRRCAGAGRDPLRGSHLSGLVVRESLGERRFAATDFPIAVGGSRQRDRDGRPAAEPKRISACTRTSCSCSPRTAPKSCTTACRATLDVAAQRRRRESRCGAPAYSRPRQRARRRGRRRQQRQHHRAADHSRERAVAGTGEGSGGTHRSDSLSRFAAAKAVRRISLSPLRVVLAAVGVVARSCLWFIFTATSVSLLTVPAAANVRVSGGLPACARRSRAAATRQLSRSRRAGGLRARGAADQGHEGAEPGSSR